MRKPMSKITVEVVNKRPKKRKSIPFAKLASVAFRPARATLMRPRLTMLGTVIGCALYFGTPHLGWDYQCAHPMNGIGTCRAASWCEYYGLQGRRIHIPETGEMCTLFKLITIDWKQLIGA